MGNSRLLMISPHHADTDYRVLRTIAEATRIFDSVDLIWDASYPGHQNKTTPPECVASVRYITLKPKALPRLALGRNILDGETTGQIRDADLVYIHASAIEGLFYAHLVKQINSRARILFDYHDSLNYELFYQLKKIGLMRLFRPAWALYRFLPKSLGRHIDYLIGISDTQIEDFQRLVSRKMPAAPVSNYRKFSALHDAPRKAVEGEEPAVVWLGAVMEGRDLDEVAAWVHRLPSQPRFLIFGNVVNETVVTRLKELLGDRVEFFGRFRDETDILPHLPARAVGVFLGWADPQGTGINGHASPNKYFTYVNMELPVLIGAVLFELAGHVTQTHAGISVQHEDDFRRAFMAVSEEYYRYAQGVRSLKSKYSDDDPSEMINRFLRDVKKDLS